MIKQRSLAVATNFDTIYSRHTTHIAGTGATHQAQVQYIDLNSPSTHSMLLLTLMVPRFPSRPAVIKDFCKIIGVDNKQVQGVIRLAKKNGEYLGFLA